MVNISPKFFYTNARISYKNVTVQKKLMFQKELTLLKQVHQKNASFVIIGTLKMLDLDLNRMFVTNVTMY